MEHWPDTHATGSVIAACLSPQALADFDPAVRLLLAGTREFTRRGDGSWCPCGSQLGMARCFAGSDLRPRGSGA
jgi:hypothetical protein